MTSAWVSVGVPIATLALGYGGSLTTEMFRDRRAADRAKGDRAATANEKREERRDTFELETLLRAQTSLSDLSRAAARHHLADVDAAQATGMYGRASVSDEFGQALLTANRAVYETAALILDDDIRGRVLAAQKAVNAPSAVRGTVDEAERLLFSGVTAVDEAQKSIGARVRAIHAGSVTTP